jgi:hypothetical protein
LLLVENRIDAAKAITMAATTTYGEVMSIGQTPQKSRVPNRGPSLKSLAASGTGSYNPISAPPCPHNPRERSGSRTA